MYSCHAHIQRAESDMGPECSNYHKGSGLCIIDKGHPHQLHGVLNNTEVKERNSIYTIIYIYLMYIYIYIYIYIYDSNYCTFMIIKSPTKSVSGTTSINVFTFLTTQKIQKRPLNHNQIYN